MSIAESVGETGIRGETGSGPGEWGIGTVSQETQKKDTGDTTRLGGNHCLDEDGGGGPSGKEIVHPRTVLCSGSSRGVKGLSRGEGRTAVGAGGFPVQGRVGKVGKESPSSRVVRRVRRLGWRFGRTGRMGVLVAGEVPRSFDPDPTSEEKVVGGRSMGRRLPECLYVLNGGHPVPIDKWRNVRGPVPRPWPTATLTRDGQSSCGVRDSLTPIRPRDVFPRLW